MKNCIVLFLSLLSILANAQSKDWTQFGTHSPSTLAFADLVDSSRNMRKVPIKVLYPTESGNYPLVVFSHGAGGNWDTHFAQAKFLCSHGFVVMLVEHTGSNTPVIKKNLRIFKNLRDMVHDGNEVLGRPKDISFAITQAEKLNKSNTQLKDKINLQEIAVAGHSYGAYTVLTIAGAKPALDWLEPKSNYGKGLAPDLSDPRVKVCIAMSPQGVGEPFFLQNSFESIKKPILAFSGTEDKLLGGKPAIDRYNSFSLWPATGKNYFVWLNNAKHLDFADAEGGETKGLDSPNREEVQKFVKASMLMFLDFHLNHNEKSLNSLNDKGLQPYLSEKIDKVEVRVR